MARWEQRAYSLLTPARRNQFNVGLEQQFGRKLSVQARILLEVHRRRLRFQQHPEYAAQLSHPVSEIEDRWRSSARDPQKRARLQRIQRAGTQPVPAVQSRNRRHQLWPAYAPVARPDHDQGFQQTTNLQYQFPRRNLRGLWLGLTWRFDSGLVVVSVPDYATALTLTGDEQQEIGLYCGNVFATVDQPLRTCTSPHYGATLIRIVPPGTYNADTQPIPHYAAKLIRHGPGC